MNDILNSPVLGKNGGESFLRLVKYSLSRLVTILVTIVISIFIVVLIMNQNRFIDDAVASEIRTLATQYVQANCSDCYILSPQRQNEILEYEIAKQTALSGLNLPYLPRQLHWTWNVLTFDWNDIQGFYGGSEFEPPKRTFWALTGTTEVSQRALAIVLQYFPNTLLIFGTSLFLVFLIGLPLALCLSSRYGSRLDKLLTALAPISSIPSWAHGVLLVSIFAFQLHWLPSRGMNDVIPSGTAWGTTQAVLRHMILPVLAFVLSMLFQVIYAWRSYFMLYAQEDYVEVGLAKGLSPKVLERRYILRPTLPYVITSFALMLLGFWQLTTALEYYFNWPGIGFLYIQALLTGDLIVSVGIVVIFAYLLGGIMLILDLVYALVDPRIHVGSQQPIKVRLTKASMKKYVATGTQNLPNKIRVSQYPSAAFQPGRVIQDLGMYLKQQGQAVHSILRELFYYPSAAIGLGLIVLFLIGSLVSIVIISRGDQELWQGWYHYSPSKYYRPTLALPVWVNWFRIHDLPGTLVLDSRGGTDVQKTSQPNGSGGNNILITYTFSLPDGDFPEEILLYFSSDYTDTMPFVTPVWIMPDGREIRLGNRSIAPGETYSLSDGVPHRFLNADYQLSASTAQPGVSGFAPFTYLLSSPEYETPTPLSGTYSLRLEVITFDTDSTLDAELVILGKVYGPSGTDNLRRDLSIALVWGLPVALGIGLLGAVVTTFVSMLVAAVGAWFGGWVDALAQRVTELNMILPILAIGVLLSYYFRISLLIILGVVVLLNAFGGTTKVYRAAFLQIKESPYIEAACAYGANTARIIFCYLVPRILPVLLPQLVSLIPGYVFLEATLAMFRVGGLGIPTWGGIIYDALYLGAYRGHFMWVLQPVVLLLVMGLAFAMVGFALDRILNPRMRNR